MSGGLGAVRPDSNSPQESPPHRETLQQNNQNDEPSQDTTNAYQEEEEEEKGKEKESAEIPPAEQQPHRSRAATALIIIALGMATFLAALHVAIVTTASPSIAQALKTSQAAYSWIGSACFSISTGLLINKTGHYLELIIGGMLFATLGFGLFINLQPYTSWPRIILFHIITAIGLGPQLPGPTHSHANQRLTLGHRHRHGHIRLHAQHQFRHECRRWRRHHPEPHAASRAPSPRRGHPRRTGRAAGRRATNLIDVIYTNRRSLT